MQSWEKVEAKERAGLRLKRRREELNLRYRDVEQASHTIAARRRSSEYVIALSRLADIENKSTVPSIYRLYSMCAIYRLDFAEVLDWYGINLGNLPSDIVTVEISRTHTVSFQSNLPGTIEVPIAFGQELDLKKTTYLSRLVKQWGTLPLRLLNSFDLKDHRYAFVGTSDFFMHPLVRPGSLVLIDETKRTIVEGGWTSEYERPIYFVEHRAGFVIGWCVRADRHIVLQPHPSSEAKPLVYNASEVDIIGQVDGLAMHLAPVRRPRTRS